MNPSPVFLWQCLAGYLAAVNALALLLYGADKYRAQHGSWRISEKALLTVAALGGSVGALAGMRLFRHKTRHARFRYGVPLLLALHVALLMLLAVRCGAAVPPL